MCSELSSHLLSPTIAHPSGLQKAVQRSGLARVCRSGELVTEITVGAAGFVYPQTVGWHEYWAPLALGMPPLITAQLDSLRCARQTYVSSGFDPSAAVPYCREYFALTKLALASASSCWLDVFLQALSSLEVFPIRLRQGGSNLAAGVFAIRHPVYLLSKLRQPKAYEDPKFLPLAACQCETNGEHSGVGIYYHYRQVGLDEDGRNTMLVLPSTDLSQRADSFKCIADLLASLGHEADPRSRQRADRITDLAIAPFLAARTSFAGGAGGSASHTGEPPVFFPLRSFNCDSMLLSDSSSLIASLVKLGNLVVIEDVDLNADELREHLASHGLTEVAASDATNRKRMRLGSLFCLARTDEAANLPGRRVW